MDTANILRWAFLTLRVKGELKLSDTAGIVQLCNKYTKQTIQRYLCIWTYGTTPHFQIRKTGSNLESF